MISKKDYSKILLAQRNYGITFKTFMPKLMWIKVILYWIVGGSFSVLLIFTNKEIGIFLLGFIFCQIYMIITMKYKSAKYWDYTQEVIDWNKVEIIADDTRR